MAFFGFPKSQRITKHLDFQRVLSQGKKIHSKHFIVVFCQTDHHTKRLGLIVSKKIGNAVKRNRAKRLIREFFRLNKALFPEYCDMVIIAKKGAHTLNYHQVAAELKERIVFEPQDRC